MVLTHLIEYYESLFQSGFAKHIIRVEKTNISPSLYWLYCRVLLFHDKCILLRIFLLENEAFKINVVIVDVCGPLGTAYTSMALYRCNPHRGEREDKSR